VNSGAPEGLAVPVSLELPSETQIKDGQKIQWPKYTLITANDILFFTIRLGYTAGLIFVYIHINPDDPSGIVQL
jgi:hypothetical protein